jgi:hypothetical protein
MLLLEHRGGIKNGIFWLKKMKALRINCTLQISLFFWVETYVLVFKGCIIWDVAYREGEFRDVDF